MSVHCANRCGTEVFTETRASKLGWAKLQVKVGGVTPITGGTFHYCPRCWTAFQKQVAWPFVVMTVGAYA